MRLLWLATKAPWPTVDGGRLVAQLTLEALVARGYRPTVLAPTDRRGEDLAREGAERGGYRLERVRASPSPRWLEAAKTPFAGRPWTVRRHALPALARRAAELARERGFDVAHAEQIQALASARELPESLPLVLRAQNVESDLWRGLARRRPLLAPAVRLEAERLAKFEGEAVRRAAATVTLTAEDAARLGALASGGSAARPAQDSSIHPIPAPFPARLEPPPGNGSRLPGAPALSLFGSAGWWPNRDGIRWFLERAWPAVRSARPGAVLHLFGYPGALGLEGVVQHPAPEDSAEALPAENGALVVPLFVASGVRMKILEAWARGVPVLASPAAARGLALESARGEAPLLLADQPEEWGRRVAQLAERREGLVRAARERLETHHAPAAVAARLEEVYRAVRAGSPPREALRRGALTQPAAPGSLCP
ncbi:MAG: glycosyltransferase family 4 protein [Acidobacteriota bacterium]